VKICIVIFLYRTVDYAPLRSAEQCKSVANQSWTIYQENPVSNGTWVGFALTMQVNNRALITTYQQTYMQQIVSSAVCAHGKFCFYSESFPAGYKLRND
jgi:hypothetical protein